MCGKSRLSGRLSLTLLAGFSTWQPLGAVSTDKPTEWTAEMALQVKQVGSAEVSPDGSQVAFLVGEAIMEGEKSEWLSHIHIANSDGSGSFQLTRGEKSATSPAWSPDGKWIGFTSSRSGKQNIWRVRLQGGEAQQITDEKGGIGSFKWSPDGKRIAFTMPLPPADEEEKKKKEKWDARVIDEGLKNADLYVVSLEKPDFPVEKITDGEVHLGGAFSGGMDWSPDGERVVFAHTPLPRADSWPQADISVVHRATKKVSTLVSTGAAESSPAFSPGGEWIAFVGSDDPPSWAFWGHVYIIPAGGGQPRRLAPTYDEQPGILGWADDGRHIFVSETARTVESVFRLPADGSPPVAVTPGSHHLDSPSINRGASHLGFVSQTPGRAPEVSVTTLAAFSPRIVSSVQQLPDVEIGNTEVIHWKSTDGMEIEGLLTYPVGYAAGKRTPLLVIVHGGPTGVFTQSFIGTRGTYPIAAFAAQGYAVLRSNIRGSSGYGKKFRYSNYGDWGGGDYRDIMSGVDHVVHMGVADPDRLGVMGWSYGGYMTSWIITQTDRFKAASVGAGVTNLMSFTGTADIPGFIPEYFGGEYWDIFEQWAAHSAMFNVKGVTTPTLIQHGEKDLRVPVSQGYELYNALKRQDVATRMIVSPRQPHGIREPKLQLQAMRANLEWFNQHLKGE